MKVKPELATKESGRSFYLDKIIYYIFFQMYCFVRTLAY